MILDEHCFNILMKYHRGELSRRQAEESMRVHGDFLISELFLNGFSARISVDANKWRGIIGSQGI